MQSDPEMQRFVINMLENGLPAWYYYHNSFHTKYVMEKAVEIGLHSDCSREELDLLTTAALWHDTGYLVIYKGHEAESCRLANQYLPQFGVSECAISAINGMIRATIIPQKPANLLEQILADADLEYLGTDRAAELSDKLFLELQCLNPAFTRNLWNQEQIRFLSKHHYFTNYCLLHKEPTKIKYLESLTKQVVSHQ